MEFSSEFWLAIATIAPLMLITEIVSLGWFASRYQAAARELFRPGPGAGRIARRIRAALPAIIGFLLAIWICVALIRCTSHALSSLREASDAVSPMHDQRQLMAALVLIIVQAAITTASDRGAAAHPAGDDTNRTMGSRL